MEAHKDRLNLIRSALQKLEPTELAIHDESAEHAGHAGARSGGGHFALLIVSPLFAGKTAVKRHQMVYDALGDLMRHEIHAITIQAKTPDEN